MPCVQILSIKEGKQNILKTSIQKRYKQQVKTKNEKKRKHNIMKFDVHKDHLIVTRRRVIILIRLEDRIN